MDVLLLFRKQSLNRSRNTDTNQSENASVKHPTLQYMSNFFY